MAPDKVSRFQVPKLHELFEFEVGDGAVLLPVPGDEPLNVSL
ncbi:hypothetical protein W911_06540 [Hyphomicrobium nitrativorans NL23]|uniref:Uncharacterized protein n=1 Tax=Hyphomicrobium nitrativorans NL23 TaxID=1029756 RepID=V5SHM9_9HYPH|nr:hypothetical protein W911_06540 [Hyphomicrobium nitrativorans NL23]